LSAYRDSTGVPVGLMVLSIVAAALVGLGATYGGSLVFDYGFNVETAGDSPVWHPSEIDLLPGQHPATPEASPADAETAPAGS
jgi:hypothetical protein